MASDASCPSCACESARRIGALPEANVFAGRDARGTLPRSSLYRCAACGLMFRHPVLSAAEYEALYAGAKSECWSDEPGRMDWGLVEDYLARNAAEGATILDFGCHTGGLLAHLGPRYSRTGVEVNAAAAAIARESTGAQVVASLRSLPREKGFDFATAVDTVEHFADPGSAIGSLLEVLKPGGTLLVTTGDADNGLWRITGTRWWYCFYPEHLAFISERWMRGWLQRTTKDARLVETRKFRHLQLSPLRYVSQVCFTLAYLAAPRAHSALARALRRRRGADPNVYPPGTGLTKDHVFLVLRKAG